MSASTWEDRLMSAHGDELMATVRRRLERPYEEGPPLDDRNGEGAGEIIERLAVRDSRFRLQLEQAFCHFFCVTPPAEEGAHIFISGVLDIVQRLALAGVFSALRAWLQVYRVALSDEPNASLARAALGALATTQTAGLQELRDFWLGLWREGPSPWRPRAFIGLRLHDPRVAASEIPSLIQNTRELKQNPGPLLVGLWRQPGGRDALVEWFVMHQTTEDGRAARSALERLLSQEERRQLPRAAARRRLPSLAAPGRGEQLSEAGE